ncbi:hypothetical protein D3C73_1529230 [compost metagenome]
MPHTVDQVLHLVVQAYAQQHVLQQSRRAQPFGMHAAQHTGVCTRTAHRRDQLAAVEPQA